MSAEVLNFHKFAEALNDGSLIPNDGKVIPYSVIMLPWPGKNAPFYTCWMNNIFEGWEK